MNVERPPNPNKYIVNFQFANGGLGDCIAQLPAIEYVLQHHKHIMPHLWVPDYFLDFAKRSLSPGAVIRPFSQHKKYITQAPGKSTDNKHHNNLATHMTDHAFHVLVNKQVGPEHKNYLPVKVDDIDISGYNLPDKYVVITTGFTVEVREMLPDCVNGLTDYVLGKGYTPVYLGKTHVFNGASHTIQGTFKADYSRGIDLIDSTDLLEAAAIMYGAAAVVGLDNGLLHLATTHPTLPVVGGFTTVDPIYRMAYRNNTIGYNYYPVVPQGLGCRFCQSNMVLEYSADFTKCFYSDLACIKMLTADKYIAELEKVL